MIREQAATYLRNYATPIEHVVSDLLDGISVFCVAPGAADQLLDAVRSMLRRELLTDCALDLETADATGAPAIILRNEVLNDPRLQAQPRALMEARDCPDVIIIRGWASLDAIARDSWARFAVGWSDAARNRPERGRQHMLLFPVDRLIGAATGSQLPDDDVRLHVHTTWGYPTYLSTATLARELSAAGEARFDWLEMAVVELASGDPQLVSELMDSQPGDRAELVQQLQGYGRRAGWSERGLEQMGALRLRDAALPATAARRGPPAQYRELWQAGVLSWTREYGMELHAAALALLSRESQLDQRLWRGQMRNILPALDQSRHNISRLLCEQYGTQWIHFADCEHPSDIIECDGLLIAEFGFLSRAISSPKVSPMLREQLKRPVEILQAARNDLAHYRPLSPGGVAQVEQVLDSFGDGKARVKVELARAASG